MQNKIEKMPKVELHIHLDGSLDIEKLAAAKHIDSDELYKKMIVSENCRDLNEYLDKFDYPISVMQTPEEIENAMYNLCIKLKKYNIIYSEIRFAPAFHTKKGLTQSQVVKSAINGLKKSQTNYNIILCCMRNLDMDTNLDTIDVAYENLNNGVVAIDLAGAEAIYQTSNFKYIFDYAKKKKVPYTIHAGEADGVNSIKAAISFGTKRIGHGIKCINDNELINNIIKDKITLEICPTSNIQTKAVNKISEHPIYNLYKKGIKTTINTDNMTVSNTNLNQEYTKLINTFNLTLNDLKQMNINAIDASFLSEEKKNELKKIIYEYN